MSIITTDIRVPGTRYMKEGGYLALARFAHGDGPCLLIMADDGTVGLRASVNVEAADLARAGISALGPNRTAIKDWSENEGVLKALIDGGVVPRDTDALLIPCGLADAVVVRIADHVMALMPPVDAEMV